MWYRVIVNLSKNLCLPENLSRNLLETFWDTRCRQFVWRVQCHLLYRSSRAVEETESGNKEFSKSCPQNTIKTEFLSRERFSTMTYRVVKDIQHLDGSVFTGGSWDVHGLDVRRVVEVDQLFWDLWEQSEQVHGNRGGKINEQTIQRNEGVCVAHCVSVHETPDRCSHFTGEEDHQEEEELRREKKYSNLKVNLKLID